MKVAILSRSFRRDAVIRQLACGHEQKESSGGHARTARTSWCGSCAALKAPPLAPVLGVCGAIVLPLKEGRARPCGRPARYLKRGDPRCGFHAARGAR